MNPVQKVDPPVEITPTQSISFSHVTDSGQATSTLQDPEREGKLP